MFNVRRTLVCLVPWILAGVSAEADKTDLTPAELLLRIREAQASVPPASFHANYSIDYQYAGHPESTTHVSMDLQMYVDRTRISRKNHSRSEPAQKDKKVQELYNHAFWDGEMNLDAATMMNDGKPIGAWGGTTTKQPHYDQVRRTHAAGELSGIFPGDSRPYFEILAKAVDGVEVTVDDSTIDGVTAYVLEAKTDRGHYKVWVDPSRGFNLLKAEIRRKSSDLGHDDVRLSDYQFMPQKESNMRFETKKIEEIDGRFVVVDGRMVYNKEYMNKLPNGSVIVTATSAITIDSVTFNPDMEQLRPFVPEMPDGTIITDLDLDTQFVWQNGKLAPFVLLDQLLAETIDTKVEEAVVEASAQKIDDVHTKAPNAEALPPPQAREEEATKPVETEAIESAADWRALAAIAICGAAVMLFITYRMLRRG